MSAAKTFVDTNVLIYAFTSDEPEKQESALKALDGCLPVVSTQVIREFSNILLRKSNMAPQDVKGLVIEIIDIADILNEEPGYIFDAIDLHNRYGYSFYDSLIIAAALSSKCQALLSEDMQSGQVIDSTLKILNPFGKDTT